MAETINLNDIVNSVVEYEVNEGKLSNVIPSMEDLNLLNQKIEKLLPLNDININNLINDLSLSFDNQALSDITNCVSSQIEIETELENYSNANYVKFVSDENISVLLAKDIFDENNDLISSEYGFIIKTPSKVNANKLITLTFNRTNDYTVINSINEPDEPSNNSVNIKDLFLKFTHDLSGNLSVGSMSCTVNFDFDENVIDILSVNNTVFTYDSYEFIYLTPKEQININEETNNLLKIVDGFLTIKNYKYNDQLSSYAENEQLSSYAEGLTFDDFCNNVINSETLSSFLEYSNEYDNTPLQRGFFDESENIKQMKTVLGKFRTYGFQLVSKLDDIKFDLNQIRDAYFRIRPNSNDLPKHDEYSECCIWLEKYEIKIKEFRNAINIINLIKLGLESEINKNGNYEHLCALIGFCDGLAKSFDGCNGIIRFFKAVEKFNPYGRDISPRFVVTAGTILLIGAILTVVGGITLAIGIKLKTNWLIIPGMILCGSGLALLTYGAALKMLGIAAVAVPNCYNQIEAMASRLGSSVNNFTIKSYIQAEQKINNSVNVINNLLNTTKTRVNNSKIVIKGVDVILERPRPGRDTFYTLNKADITASIEVKHVSKLSELPMNYANLIEQQFKNPKCIKAVVDDGIEVVKIAGNKGFEMRTLNMTMQLTKNGGTSVNIFDFVSKNMPIGTSPHDIGKVGSTYAYLPFSTRIAATNPKVIPSIGQINSRFQIDVGTKVFKELYDLAAKHNPKSRDDDNIDDMYEDEIDINDPYFYITITSNPDDCDLMSSDGTKTLMFG